METMYRIFVILFLIVYSGIVSAQNLSGSFGHDYAVDLNYLSVSATLAKSF
jgi:hypothetical protein